MPPPTFSVARTPPVHWPKWTSSRRSLDRGARVPNTRQGPITALSSCGSLTIPAEALPRLGLVIDVETDVGQKSLKERTNR